MASLLSIEDEEDDVLSKLNFDDLNLISQEDDILNEDEALAGHIQENLDDELVQEALSKGLDLRQYSREIESELCKVELRSVQDYIGQSKHIASLHYQIMNCDDILSRMEEMLSKFQSDLGSISSEIQCLQDQSNSMSIKLKNRQSVRGELSQYVSEMTVTEHLIQHITDTPASEREFLENLHDLDHKINFINLQEFNDCHAVFDVRDVVDKLKIKAVAKTREFILHKVYLFRKPMANYQMLQNQLLNYRYFNEFLMSHSREIALQVRMEYLDTMGKIYYSYFKDYYSKLLKMQAIRASAQFDDVNVKIGRKDPQYCPYFKELNYILKESSTQPSDVQPLPVTRDGVLTDIHVVNCTLPPSPPPPRQLSPRLEEVAVSESTTNASAECEMTELGEEDETSTYLAAGGVSGVPTTSTAIADLNPSTSRKGSQQKRKVPDDDILELIARLEDASEAREDAHRSQLLEHEERMEEIREQREDQRRQREQEHEERILSMFLSFFEQLSQQFQGFVRTNNSNPSFSQPPSSPSTEPSASSQPHPLPAQPSTSQALT